MGTRSRNGNMEVATDIYTNGNRVIAVVGVCHIAEESYWDNLNKRISGYESMGYSVQYEMVKNDLQDQPEKAKLLATGKLYQMIAELTGLESQGVGLKYKKHWTNTDITASEMLKYASMETLAELIKKATEGLEKVMESEHRETAGEKIRFCIRWMPLFQLLAPNQREHMKVLLDLRNDIAADAMLNAEGNVVSIWGAKHLKGIGELLRAKGFKRESRVWTPAVREAVAAVA